MIAFVAGGAADLFDLEDHGIGIAIHKDLLHDLHIARLFALVPELGTGTGPIDAVSGFERFLPGLLVDVGEHEDLAGLPVLGDGGDEPPGLLEIKFDHGAKPRAVTLRNRCRRRR